MTIDNRKLAVAGLLIVGIFTGMAIGQLSASPSASAAPPSFTNYPPAKDLDSAAHATPVSKSCPILVRLKSGKLLHLFGDLAIAGPVNSIHAIGVSCYGIELKPRPKPKQRGQIL